jgi:diguanylate cyclase (GGDEF)-like protein
MDEFKLFDHLYQPVIVINKEINLLYTNTAWKEYNFKHGDTLEYELKKEKNFFLNMFEELHEKNKDFIEFTLFLNKNSSGQDIAGKIIFIEKNLYLIELKINDSYLETNSLFDSLTKLPTRQLLHDRIQQDILKCNREKEKNKLGILFIDLDKFKQINDTIGHKAGDFVLIEVVKRIKNNIRVSDTLARYGGDEFIVTCPGLYQGIHVALVAKRIVKSLLQPFYFQNEKMFIGCSIGISIYPDHSAEHTELIGLADKAMYKAKRSGGNMYIFSNKE